MVRALGLIHVAALFGTAVRAVTSPFNCPTLKEVTMDTVLLAQIAFPATLHIQWNGSADANYVKQFTVSVGGDVKIKKANAMMVKSNDPMNMSQSVVDIRIQSSYTMVPLSFTISDPSGNCASSTAEFKQYVYGKHIPLAPLVIVLVLAPLTREVYFSLGVGGLLGTWILERDLWYAFLRYFDTALTTTIAGGFSKILLFMWLLGGVGGAAIRSGGVKGMGEKAASLVRDSFLGQLVVYLMGFVIFMDDYANTMIVGTALRPVSDRVRVSREKLSFIVDCTASPIAGIMPLSTWIAHEITQIDIGLKAVNWTGDSAYLLFLDSIPYRFYSWFMLIFVLVNILIGRDWAWMYWAEQRARETGEVCEGVRPKVADGTTIENVDKTPSVDPAKEGFTMLQTETHIEVCVKPGIPCRWWNAIIPFFGLVAMFLPLLFYNGATQNGGGIGWDKNARDIIGNADSWATLHWVGGFTVILQMALYAVQYNKEWGGCLLTPRETIDATMNGGIMYFKGGIALLLAFAYADTVKRLQISKWLIDGLGDTSEAGLPPLVFILCAVFSLATGTSWGTMTVFMPAVIPLAVHVGGIDNKQLLTTVISAVLGGAVWGDHCSPVSDTTILSAASSQVSLFDHAKTQLPYAFFTGIMAICFGFAPAGGGAPAGVCILMGLILVPAVHVGLSFIPKFGGPVNIYDPALDGISGQGLPGALASVKSLFKGAKRLSKQETGDA